MEKSFKVNVATSIRSNAKFKQDRNGKCVLTLATKGSPGNLSQNTLRGAVQAEASKQPEDKSGVKNVE